MKKSISTMKTTPKFVLTAFVITWSLSSCAVMFQGSKKEVVVKSMTPGASIYIDGDLKGSDMVKERLRRKHNHIVLVKKEGYNEQSIEINKRVQVGWVIFDSLVNWFAFLTDPTTGAWNTFDKDHIVVSLTSSK